MEHPDGRNLRRHLFRGAVVAVCLFGGLRAAAAECGDFARVAGSGDRYFVLAEGDSITFGQGSTDGLGSYVQRSCLLRANAIETVVAAKSSAILGSPTDSAAVNSVYGRLAADNAILAAKRKQRIAILSILIGRNDLIGYNGGNDAYADALAAYILTMRRAGWDRVIVGTVLPSTWAPFDAQRDDLNSILTSPGWAAAHGIDAIADFAGSPAMGRDGAAADAAMFIDGIHPTNRGYAVMAGIFDTALRSVLRPVR